MARRRRTCAFRPIIGNRLVPCQTYRQPWCDNHAESTVALASLERASPSPVLAPETAAPLPEPADAAAETLAALGRSALTVATLDTALRVAWCTPAWAALFQPPATTGQPIDELLGQATAAQLVAGEALDCDLFDTDGLPSPWRLQLQGSGTHRVVCAERRPPSAPLQAAHDQLRAAHDQLQERLELVQSLTRTGVFEHDPVTLKGEWDAQMYQIWGLPAPSSTTAAPDYRLTTSMILNEDLDPNVFLDSLSRPGLHGQRVRIRRPDGALRYLHARWRVTAAAPGQPSRVLGINTDDSEVYALAHRAESLGAELEVALELGNIALWRQDLSNDRVVLDSRGCDMIGVPYSELGLHLAEARALIHPDDRHLAAASAELTLRTGEPSDMNLRLPGKTGGWRHVLMRRALLRGANGHALAFVGVLLDVSERVAASQQAQELDRRLQAAAEAARIGLWSTSPDSGLQNWNQGMFTLFGLDPGAGPLPLRDWLLRCAHPDDLARVRKTVFDWWHGGGGGLDIEFRIVRPSDGAQRWLVTRGELRREPLLGGARIAEGVVIDITEFERTLQRLRETLDRMTLASQALGLGAWESETRTGEARWDMQMFRLRGITSAARTIQPDEMASMLHPEDRATVMATQHKRMHDGQPWHSEFRVCWPDGQVRWLTSQSVPVLDVQGQEQRRFGINWDSTEAHAAIESTRLTERALAEGRAKSQTLSRISHELRTPLNAVLGFVQLLRSDTQQQQVAEPQRQRWLAHIDDAGRHLLSLIDDVLELSRVESGEPPRALQTVALAPLIDATLALLAREAAAAQLELRCGAVDGAVLADPVRLRQVVINLLSNAIKYNRPGGQVRLWTSRHLDQLLLHVADTGQGMTAEQVRQAFEPFNRLGAEYSNIDGSGLGLAIVKSLVEQMGGQVDAHSQADVGTEFTVALPAASAALPLATTASVPSESTWPATGPPARLLYIEDNPVNALLVQELLATRPGIELRLAETGLDGIGQARDWQPALVLLDMQLPDIDGHQVLQALRADPATAHLRCVALSANAMPADLQAARDAGFEDYWTKPIHFDHFLRDLSALLGRTL